MPTEPESIFPVDPLKEVQENVADDVRRRMIVGILESYNGSYDVLGEGVQNSVDALEDAALADANAGPFLLTVTINLRENWISILDTGCGMEPRQIARAFAPSSSFKVPNEKRKKNPYRGYKGVGLTFLAYGTDDITIHSKKDGVLTKGRMQYARAWAEGRRTDAAVLNEDEEPSPLEKYDRGTYIKVKFSDRTRPRQLSRLAGSPEAWITILRTRTAIGQILFGRDALVEMNVSLVLVTGSATTTHKVEPLFLLPNLIKRTPVFRFQDLVEYHKSHTEQIAVPPEKQRQDGLYLTWTTERILSQLSDEQKQEFDEELKVYEPTAYAFIPYQGSIWGDLNSIATLVKNRDHLKPGLMIATNRQRVADLFEIKPSRFETFSRNVLVCVHFENAKPDYGRKTVQDEVLRLAEKIADRVVQWLATQRDLLRPPGESPTPEARQVESDHDDWIFNVRKHAEVSPIHAPPLALCSSPLTEQDVVGFFHQLTTVGVFPGLSIFATSQIKTYDCLVSFNCPTAHPALAYKDVSKNPFGISPYIKGTAETFKTRNLTLEFKNNLDALVEDVDDSSSKKSFRKIDIAVCWGTVATSFPGFQLEEITEHNLDERRYPGVTHLLRKDGEGHVVQVVLLNTITEAIKAGRVIIPVPDSE